jgi:hypothetical protein
MASGICRFSPSYEGAHCEAKDVDSDPDAATIIHTDA